MAKKTKRPKLHNHVRKILYLARLGRIPARPGMLTMVDIAHDAWCNFLVDPRQRCNCDPDIRPRWTYSAAAQN